MQKKKFEFNTDVIQVIDENPEDLGIKLKDKKPIVEEVEKVAITFRATPKFKKDFKTWCARNDFTFEKAILDGFELLRKKYDTQ